MAKQGGLRVLFVSKTSVGAPWAVRLVRDLVDLGVEVHMAVPDWGPRVAEYQEAGATVHFQYTGLDPQHPWRTQHILRQIRTLVRQIDPDIIHALHVRTAISLRLALGKSHAIPRVFQVPGPLHLEHPLSRTAELASAGAADYWIGTCQWICDEYRRSGVSGKHVFFCTYGVDVEAYGNRRRGKLRHELGLGADAKIVGMVGYMYPPKRVLGQRRGLKGHEDLIDALAICQSNDPTITGVFIGGAWNGATAYEERVHAYAKERCGDRAIFLGSRTDVAELLPDFDLAVQPSHTESIAHSAIEAQLSGVPVVATQVGGLAELINNGENGWLVPPKRPSDLAETIAHAFRSPERLHTVAERGRDQARQRFDAHARARDVLAIYERI